MDRLQAESAIRSNPKYKTYTDFLVDLKNDNATYDRLDNNVKRMVLLMIEKTQKGENPFYK